MSLSALGRAYESGEIIVRQGDPGNCMYVVQEGQLEVVREDHGAEVRVGILGEGEFFGEMSLFEREKRAATVRALGPVRILTVDRKTLMRRVHEDPSVAFNLLQTMCRRIRKLDAELHQTQALLAKAGETSVAAEGDA